MLASEPFPFLNRIFEDVLTFLSKYGWHILIAVVGGFIIWNYIQKFFEDWQNRDTEFSRGNVSGTHQNVRSTDLNSPAKKLHQERLDHNRRQLQKAYEEAAAIAAVKAAEKKKLKEQKRIQLLEKKYPQVLGHRLGVSKVS